MQGLRSVLSSLELSQAASVLPAWDRRLPRPPQTGCLRVTTSSRGLHRADCTVGHTVPRWCVTSWPGQAMDTVQPAPCSGWHRGPGASQLALGEDSGGARREGREGALLGAVLWPSEASDSRQLTWSLQPPETQAGPPAEPAPVFLTHRNP